MSDDDLFTKSLTDAALLKKIVKLMAEVGTIKKDGTNDFHKYKYLSDAAVCAKVQPLLVQLGLVAVPQYRLVSYTEGLAIVEATLTIFDSESGAALFPEPKGLGSGADKGDKAVMKAETAASKYAWMGLLKIPTGDDPEADASTDKPEIQRPRAISPQPDAPAVVKPREPIFAESAWLSGAIEVTNIEKKSTNPKAPYLVTVLDDPKPWKLFGDKNAERLTDLMKLGEPIAVRYTKRSDKWETDARVIEEVPHADANADPF